MQGHPEGVLTDANAIIPYRYAKMAICGRLEIANRLSHNRVTKLGSSRVIRNDAMLHYVLFCQSSASVSLSFFFFYST